MGRGDEEDRTEECWASEPRSEEKESKLHAYARETTQAGIEEARTWLAREPVAPDSQRLTLDSQLIVCVKGRSWHMMSKVKVVKTLVGYVSKNIKVY